MLLVEVLLMAGELLTGWSILDCGMSGVFVWDMSDMSVGNSYTRE